MDFADYRKQDATGVARLVAKGEVSADEVIEAAIERAEEVNGAVNCIVVPQYAQGRAAAKAGPSGPLAGVPYLIKDLGTYQKGD